MDAVGGRPATGASERSDVGRLPAERRPDETAGEAGRGDVRLAAELESVGVGRRWLRERLEREIGDEHPAVGDVLQALSEALTNAIIHGDGLHVRLAYAVDGGRVEVQVVNGVRTDGTGPRQRRPVGPDAESGRGLDLVEAFSDEWGITPMASGQVKVWFGVGIP